MDKFPKYIKICCLTCGEDIVFERNDWPQDDESDPSYDSESEVFSDGVNEWFCSADCAARYRYDPMESASFSDLKQFLPKKKLLKKKSKKK